LLGNLNALFSASTNKFAPEVSSPSIPVQSAYAHNEKFCGPLGTVRYTVSGGRVAIQLDIYPLRPKTQFAIDWINNQVRGYAVGTFTTNRAGDPIDSTVQLYRGGEVSGVEMNIDLVGSTPTTGHHLYPC
jgi:hypothetical protein